MSFICFYLNHVLVPALQFPHQSSGDAYLSTGINCLTASGNLYYGVQMLTGTTKLAGSLSLWSLKYCCQQLVLASLVG
uniref:Uncharacterized protein n=1 Tax=Leersia perrieri TaxID=77586 RepID=A0A0D9XLJ4_9ORYZ